jgi:filamentous hemagglutinin family protein
MKSNQSRDRHPLVVAEINVTTQNRWLLLVSIAGMLGLSLPAQAQITGTNGTTVTPVGNTTDITGGQSVGTNPTNLFHTFGQFNVGNGQTANFVATPTIVNVLGRVNGGTPSVIDGTLKVTGGNNPNLFLMNPAGIVFGAGATLNVPGSFTATTATSIEFGKGNWFNAFDQNTPNNYAALLGNPTGLGFVSGVQPGSIFSAANLTTTPGQSITLVGGTVISMGTIKTEGGNITIATVPDNKFVRLSSDGNLLSLDLPVDANNQMHNARAENFKPLALPELLTSSQVVKDITANHVTVGADGVVSLKTDPTLIIANGDTVTKPNRTISQGDVITKDLDAGIPNSFGASPILNSDPALNAGNVQIESNKAILTGQISTSNRDFGGFVLNQQGANSGGNGGNITLTAQTEIKTGAINSETSRYYSLAPLTLSNDLVATLRPTGGNVSFSTKTGDIIVDSISTQNSAIGTGIYSARGGNLSIDAGGLFRVVDYIPSFFSSVRVNNYGNININHGGTEFIIGGKATEVDNPPLGTTFKIDPAPPEFIFPASASGSLGVIITSVKINGNLGVVYSSQNVSGINVNSTAGNNAGGGAVGGGAAGGGAAGGGGAVGGGVAGGGAAGGGAVGGGAVGGGAAGGGAVGGGAVGGGAVGGGAVGGGAVGGGAAGGGVAGGGAAAGGAAGGGAAGGGAAAGGAAGGGVAGANGANGVNGGATNGGANGANGVNGTNGTAANGANGANGNANGANGNGTNANNGNGSNQVNGNQGENGTQGETKTAQDDANSPSDQKVTKRKTAIQCDRNAQAAAKAKIDRLKSGYIEKPNTSAADPCDPKFNGNAILQILNGKKSQ